MPVLTILGLIFSIILAIPIPRTVLAIVAGCWLGGAWWWLFAPLAIIGLILDLDSN